MTTTFKLLPIDFLLNSWKNKLKPEIAGAFIQLGRLIADRDLNLASVFDDLSSRASDADEGIFYLGIKNVNGSWRIIVVGNNLSIQRRESGTWVQKGIFSA
jgi:hypothetical protein